MWVIIKLTSPNIFGLSDIRKIQTTPLSNEIAKLPKTCQRNTSGGKCVPTAPRNMKSPVFFQKPSKGLFNVWAKFCSEFLQTSLVQFSIAQLPQIIPSWGYLRSSRASQRWLNLIITVINLPVPSCNKAGNLEFYYNSLLMRNWAIKFRSIIDKGTGLKGCHMSCHIPPPS